MNHELNQMMNDESMESILLQGAHCVKAGRAVGDSIACQDGMRGARGHV